MPQRVLHLIPYMHPAAGGPPVVVDQWCDQLRRKGWDVEVATTDAYAPPDDLTWVETLRQRYPLHVGRCIGPRGFGFSPALRELLRQRMPHVDLVHVHNIWSYCNRLAASFCCRNAVPFVVSTHGMLDPNSVDRKRLKKVIYGRLREWKQLRRASGMVFTHPEEERLARQSCENLPEGHIVPLGTEDPPAQSRDQLRQAFLRSFPELRWKRRILFLGRLHPKKGLDLLLPAFAHLLGANPDAVLLLTGPGDDSYLNSLRQQAIELGIVDSVKFTGPVFGENKWRILAAADLFVLPSYQENFAISLVEAMRIGTPVICSRRVNIWGDLAEAGAAEICELTVESVADRAAKLLGDPQLSSETGRRAALLAAERFTWERSAVLLETAYSTVLSDHRTSDSSRRESPTSI